MLALTVLGIATLGGVVGAHLGKRSGRADAGFIWGFLLGPVGWLFPAGWLLTGRAASRVGERA